jgi:hypothetical protein
LNEASAESSHVTNIGCFCTFLLLQVSHSALALCNAQLIVVSLASAALLSSGFLSSLYACLPAMVRLTQQQLSSSAALIDSWMPLPCMLTCAQHLLHCWNVMVEERGPALLQTLVCTLLPLVQQLQGCGSLLMQPAAAAAAAARSAPTASVQAGSSSSSCEHQLLCALFGIQKAASTVLSVISGLEKLDAGAAAEVLRLQTDPTVAEMQLQLLVVWAALLHKQHTEQQQMQQLPPGAAIASSSSSSSSTQQQQQQQPAKQRHRADLLSIPAFHQDMLQLLPGGQAYLDAAAEEAARWGMNKEACVWGCCCTINKYLRCYLESITGQQQISRKAAVVSGAAVRLALELTLLASAALQRRQEQQQQQQQAFTLADEAMDNFALHT